MRRNKLATFIALIVLGAFAVGCKTSPVYNVENMPVSGVKAKYTRDEVKTAIMKAGTQLGWRMKPEAPGQITATFVRRDAVAVVDITYDDKSYSIKYKTSEGLSYDGTNIHNFYNNWIRQLDKRINIELSSM